ncbi:MAG: GNAT family N-acetyltransferase [Armatimonadota bacterium]|nr:GNAT family N-acetyltransferase [Armatimonadota bacterium]
MTRIAFAESAIDIERCFPIMVELRTALTPDEFVAKVQRQRALYGFKLAYLEDGGEVKAVAGFRVMENLAWGKFLYVDDLVTAAAARSQGYGDKLFDWLLDYARAEGCEQLHLDSGVQRFEAHRFYLRKRMSISSHHFAMLVR